MASTFVQSSLPVYTTISENDTASGGVILVKNHLRAKIIVLIQQKKPDLIKLPQQKFIKKITIMKLYLIINSRQTNYWGPR